MHYSKQNLMLQLRYIYVDVKQISLLFAMIKVMFKKVRKLKCLLNMTVCSKTIENLWELLFHDEFYKLIVNIFISPIYVNNNRHF